MALVLNGIGIARGIAIGNTFLLDRGEPEVAEIEISDCDVEAELARLWKALEAAQDELRAIRDRIPVSASEEVRAFIDTYLLMLQDSALTSAPAEHIKFHRCNAEWALKVQRDRLVGVFDQMDDPYLRTRRDDVAHVVNRVLRLLMHRQEECDDDMNLEGCIVIAEDLTPADTVLLQHQGVLGIVTEYGGPLSHTAIMARSMGIPAVAAAHHARAYLQPNEQIIVDGETGLVVANADTQSFAYYRQQQRAGQAYFAALQHLAREPAVTVDRRRVELLANLEQPQDVDRAQQAAAEGIGLFRTEFLFMNRSSIPDEEEQFETYAAVVRAMGGKPVTIRTLDLGADKPTGESCSTRKNPALGLRAVRLCLKDPSLFRPHLRAILRASVHGPVRMMLPMLSSTLELRQALGVVQEVGAELTRENVNFDQAMPIGGMVEVPAAAVIAGQFAQELDFLSIGTNDLIQYTLAIDRIDDEVSYLYDPLHPAVLRLIHMTIRAGQGAGIPVSMCGEMAGDRRYTRLLLGLGLRSFSMDPSALLEVKKIVKDSDVGRLARSARKALRCSDPEDMAELIDSMNDM